MQSILYIYRQFNMIYYISEHSIDAPSNCQVITNIEEALKRIHLFYDYKKYNKELNLCLDLETNGLDAYMDDILLLAIGDKKTQFIIDATMRNYVDFLPDNPKDFNWILQNGKFDFNFLRVKIDYTIIEFYDTMVAAQKLYQGNNFNPVDNPNGMKYNLPSIIKKVLKIDPNMDKEIRNEFVGISTNAFRPIFRHIEYAAKDLLYLEDLKYTLDIKLKKQGIKYMDGIGSYISGCTGLMELQGFRMNKIQWRENIKKNKELRYEQECILDNEFRILRQAFITLEGKSILIGGKYDRQRIKKPEPLQYDIFGNEMQYEKFIASSTKTKGKIKNLGNINWGSTTEIVRMFAIMELPLPVEGARISEAIPTYSIIKDKIKLTSEYKFTTKAPNLEELLNNIPKHPAKNLFLALIRYRELETAISTFGENILDKINPITGRLHTTFRTDNTTTGRFQSGQRDTMWPNLQNIPRDNSYRTCFLPRAEERVILTHDLSGAEVTILCDKAKDDQLYEWAVKNDDAHSPIATACWRNIYLYRAAFEAGFVSNKWDFFKTYWNLKKEIIDWIIIATERLQPGDEIAINKIKGLFELSQTFTISKTENKEYRQSFKNVTFAAIYNVQDRKCAKMLNILVDEAAVVLWTMKTTIPKSFEFVEQQSKIALETGKVRINNRTGCRILFPDVLRNKYAGGDIEDLQFRKRSEIEGAARNVTIQGTQADMLKEAFIECTLYYLEYNIDARVVLKVHDELVTDSSALYLPADHEFCKTVHAEKLVWYSDKVKEKLYPGRHLFLPVNKNDANKLTYEEFDKEDIKFLSINEFITQVMKTAAGRYLNHYTMGSTCEIHQSWIK